MPTRAPQVPELVWLSEGATPVPRDWARALGAPEVPATARANALGKLAFVNRQTPWLPVPLDAHWLAAYRLTVQGGAVVVAEVRVFPLEPSRWSVPGTWSAEVLGIKAPVPPGGVTSRLLRRVKVGEHHGIADVVLRRSAGWWPVSLDLPPQRTPGAGRPRKPDLWYARLAEAYAKALQRKSPRPIMDVARVQGMPPARVRDAIYRARERGLLSQAVHQGQKGGTLTPTALALLGMEPRRVEARVARRTAWTARTTRTTKRPSRRRKER